MSETPHVPPPGGSFTPPPPPPAGGVTGGSRDTAMLVLSYLWFLSIIPLVAKKEDREVQWHAKNGLSILIAEIVCWVFFFVFGFIARRIPFLGCGVVIIECGIWVAFLVVRVMAIIKGVNGQRFRLPMVSDFADKM